MTIHEPATDLAPRRDPLHPVLHRVLHPAGWPPWLQVVAIFACARLITTAALLILGGTLTAQSRGGVDPEFFDYSAIWDGDWYRIISYYGYPAQLPVDLSGAVRQNPWAFMPVYPFLVRALVTITGLRWSVAAVGVSLAFGFGAALVIYRIMRLRLPHASALFSVLLFSIGPASFILQMAYAESMQLFLLALALLLLIQRRWAPLFPVVAVMALTRPTGLAFALALGCYWIVRYLRRRSDPFPRRTMLVTGGLVLYSLAMGLAWPAIAWAVTGSLHAYTDTELAWRSGWIGQDELQLFTPWFAAAAMWFANPGGPVVVVVVVALVAAFALSFALPSVRALAIELRLWLASYGLYLLAVFFPQTSLVRLLVPMFPFVGALAAPRSRAYRIGIVVLLQGLQLLWLSVTWGPIQAYWTTP
ncbi:hypothetical protein [Naasia lichenicola]|uniref:Glycosyltransferase RgtA/B/C/D-like domain-containing protein n=1 Tax=Naasia lichenicola TaxID=2565933 RepID=A0A4S4FEB8_9MICO|nr:hypothetical protein [Naasia lichenicola]THG28480.1 hypothetical protein E6C64_16770 [Naasia lichenicola]